MRDRDRRIPGHSWAMKSGVHNGQQQKSPSSYSW